MVDLLRPRVWFDLVDTCRGLDDEAGDDVETDMVMVSHSPILLSIRRAPCVGSLCARCSL